MELRDRLRILAGAKKPCSCNGVPGACKGLCVVCKSGECCGGMGWVYILLDVVRTPCPCLYHWPPNLCDDCLAGYGCWPSCFRCHGFGWVASERLEDWLDVLLDFGGIILQKSPNSSFKPPWITAPTLLELAANALWKVLEAQGVKLEEAPGVQ